MQPFTYTEVDFLGFSDLDTRIRKRIPLLKGRTVLFVDSPYGIGDLYADEIRDNVRCCFEKVGYSFLYLPELLERLTPDLMRYMFPGLGERFYVEDLYKRIRLQAGLGDEPGFLYKHHGQTWFRPLRVDDDGGIRPSVLAFVDELVYRRNLESSRIPVPRKKNVPSPEPMPMPEPVPDLYMDIAEDIDLPVPQTKPKKTVVRKRVVPSLSDEDLDPRILAIRDEWQRIEGQYGISFEGFIKAIGHLSPPSRLEITRTYRIFLSDLPDRPEIKLDTMTKALYFFYLRHPEGLPFKELQFYEEDIYQIYSVLSNRDNPAEMRQTIAGLVDPYSAKRDPCTARIRAAFRNQMTDQLAKFYYIDGPQGGLRTISLNRDLVLWPH